MGIIGNTKINTSIGIATVQQILQYAGIDSHSFCNMCYTLKKEIQIETINGYKKISKIHIGDFQPFMSISTQNCKIFGDQSHKIAISVDENNIISWKQMGNIQIGDSIIVLDDQELKQQIVKSMRIQDLQYIYDIYVEDDDNYTIKNGIICYNYQKIKK